MKYLVLISLLVYSYSVYCQPGSGSIWSADNGNGTYSNPVLHMDYSDPDVVRHGDDYYMTASSFNCVPGLPILHSKDLINWELVSYALPRLVPDTVFRKPQHGKGVWAPCIRLHKGEFYIFYPDPDFGIYMIKTKDPKGKWSEPVLVKGGRGLIDPTPLWDDDGKAYLAYAYAGSRAGIKSLIVVCTMNPEGTVANNDEVIVFDGHANHSTIEGPKFYKRNGYYYIFAPAGGVPTGWQLILRAKNVYGPYEEKIVLEQGKTNVNGPHQGAWVQTPGGEDWFFHFQDKDAYGRIVHLQPMKWVDDWPVMGTAVEKKGKGYPVPSYKKPAFKTSNKVTAPPVSDEFNEPKLGLQWQWHANPEVYWGFPTSVGHYTMFCRPKPNGYSNLLDVSNLLLQKFPSKKFTATTKLTFHARFDGERTGLLVMGLDYSYLCLQRHDGKLYLSQITCLNANSNGQETETKRIPVDSGSLYFRVEVIEDAICSFSYSNDGKKFMEIGKPFKAREGRWIGAKIGFLALREGVINNAGSIDIDWFRVEKY